MLRRRAGRTAYILGTGPTRLTVQSVLWYTYWEGYYASSAAAEEGMTEQELIEQFLEAFVVSSLKKAMNELGQGIVR